MDAAFTPHLDSYLPGLMGGLTGPDAELREIQDKVLEMVWRDSFPRGAFTSISFYFRFLPGLLPFALTNCP